MRAAHFLQKLNYSLVNFVCMRAAGIPTCQMLFDGWSCWDYTLPGDTAFSSCPKYITGFDPTSEYKSCSLTHNSQQLHGKAILRRSGYLRRCVLRTGDYRPYVLLNSQIYLAKRCSIILKLPLGKYQ